MPSEVDNWPHVACMHVAIASLAQRGHQLELSLHQRAEIYPSRNPKTKPNQRACASPNRKGQKTLNRDRRLTKKS